MILKRPFVSDVKSLQYHLNRGLEPFFERFGLTDEDLASGDWIPPVDILEEPDRLLIRAELPGVKHDSIEISFDEGVLTIRGERGFDKETDSRRYHRIERVYGSFTRAFTLPRSANPENITADFTDGLLEVTVPKREESKPRQIRVEVK